MRDPFPDSRKRSYVALGCSNPYFSSSSDSAVLFVVVVVVVVKLTALYKHLITKTTLTYISANKTLIIVA